MTPTFKFLLAISAPLMMLVSIFTNASAQTNPSAIVDFAKAIANYSKDPDLEFTLKQFLEFSKIYRRSEQEEGIRNYLISLAKAARAEYFVDAAGNLIISVPGTGAFTGMKGAVALQAHMDMVNAVKDLKAGESSEPFFRKPLDLVVQDGWIFSRDHKTTIGADDGAGMALMVRFLGRSDLPHPPLKLIFTVREEQGLIGADQLTLPSDLKALINLDYNTFGQGAIGCLGSARVNLTYSIKADDPIIDAVAGSPTPMKQVKIDFTGLSGGHSGGSIHLGLANAVKLSAGFLAELHRKKIRASVLGMIAGEITPSLVYNKIPNSASIELQIPAPEWKRFETVIANYSKTVAAAYRNEKSIAIAAHPVDQLSGPGSGIPLKNLMGLISVLNSFPNGVIIPNKKFMNGIDLTSNLSFVSLAKDSKNGDFSISVGIMPRTFTDRYLDDFLVKMKSKFSSVKLGNFKFSLDSKSPAWTPKLGTPIAKLIAAQFKKSFPEEPAFATVQVAGGLELARFYQKNPSIPLIGMGPNIKGEHSNVESFEIESERKMIKLLDGVLIDLGNNKEIMGI